MKAQPEYVNFEFDGDLGKITYKAKIVSGNNPDQIQLVKDFNKFLDSLDPDIYNKALENFGNSFDLKEFSELVESDFLLDLSDLKNYIFVFKQAVLETIQNEMARLASLKNDIAVEIGVQLEADHSFKERLDQVITDAYNVISEAETNHLTDTQEFMQFEDALNYLSTAEHPEWQHDFKAESHIED